METVIIGGGASGLVAAIAAAARPDTHVTLLERQARVGRKLLSTGNGRCNLSNLRAGAPHYHGENPEFALPALRAFPPEETLAFFRGLGLLTAAEDSGRVYPYSNQAGSVVDVLRFALMNDKITLRAGMPARELRREQNMFLVRTDEETLRADAVIVAAGGAAGEKLGGGMDGYRLLEAMGHRCTALRPSLVQVKTDPAYPRALKGIKAEAALCLLRGGKTVDGCKGEILFTEYGVSGPAVFELSRSVSACDGGELAISLDFLPDYEENHVLELLLARRASLPALPAEQLFAGMLQGRLGQMVFKYAGGKAGEPLGTLPEEALRTCARGGKDFRLKVTGTMGMDSAQVTAGGIETGSFDPQTLESRLCPGLFACGEVLDIDGDCGGFNLQWAWSSGRLAGRLGL